MHAVNRKTFCRVGSSMCPYFFEYSKCQWESFRSGPTAFFNHQPGFHEPARHLSIHAFLPCNVESLVDTIWRANERSKYKAFSVPVASNGCIADCHQGCKRSSFSARRSFASDCGMRRVLWFSRIGNARSRVRMDYVKRTKLCAIFECRYLVFF